MIETIGIRFKEGGKIYDFDADGMKFEKGDYAMVETVRGIECGLVAKANHSVNEDNITKPLKKVIRVATEADIKTLEENKAKEKEAFDICEKKIEAHGLEMNLVDVEYTFDRSKLLFYFTADGRVDFRELVKDLASTFKTRIELRQIGVRDESRMIGGFGICGRPFCCNTFLTDFQPVSIKMAKDQGLSLNLAKISGTCGRLMCCLKYEQNVYEDLLKVTPRVGSVVSTKDGKGTVCDVSILKGTLKVKFEGSDDSVTFGVYNKEDVKVLHAPKSKNNEEVEEEIDAE